MAKKKEVVTYRTPRGIAVYPRLDTPDTKFHDLGVYKADLRLTGAAAQELIDMIQEIAVKEMGEKLPVSDAIVKVKGKYRPNEDNSCFQPEFDKETGKMTGDWVFYFKAKNHEVKDKKTGEVRLWERKPAIFSASGKKVTKVKIGGGTEYAVVFEVYVGKVSTGEPFMSLQPMAVQVYKLVEYKGGGDATAADYGIEASDGWDPEEDESDLPTNGIETNDDASGDDEGLAQDDTF